MDYWNAVDEEYGLQARILGTGPVNTPDALLLGVLTDVAAGRGASDQIAVQYQKALATHQAIVNGVAALSVLVATGVTIGPEVYAYCAVNSAACANAVTELLDCTVTVACTSTAGGVLSLGAATKVAGELEQSATAAARTAGTRTIIASDGTSVVVPAGYRPLTAAGAAANDVGGLPTGYVRVIDDAGNVVIAGPNGAIYNDVAAAQRAAAIGTDAPNGGALPNVPGRVQSRVNLDGDGWGHVVDRHFDPSVNASQFTVSQSELRQLLQSSQVVQTPVTRTLVSADGIRYVREVTFESPIGTDKFNGFQPTSTMTILTDRFGNLVTATPGRIQ